MPVSRTQPESLLKNQIFHYLSLQPEFFGFYVTQGGVYDEKRGIFRNRRGAGMRLGVSDIIGVFNGTAVALEIKTKTGVVSEHQKRFMEQFIAHGGLAAVLRSVDEAVDWVKAIRIVSSRSLGEA